MNCKANMFLGQQTRKYLLKCGEVISNGCFWIAIQSNQLKDTGIGYGLGLERGQTHVTIQLDDAIKN